MYQKKHVGSLKETVVLRFTDGYQITLEAGVEMSMSLTMISKKQFAISAICFSALSLIHPAFALANIGISLIYLGVELWRENV